MASLDKISSQRAQSLNKVSSQRAQSKLPKSLPRPKLQALEFVKRMFLHRGYKRKHRLQFYAKQNLLELFTTDRHGNKVMAILAKCQPFGSVMEIEEFTHETNHDDGDTKSFRGSDQAKNQNTGMDFIKSIVDYCRKHYIQTVVIVTDFITSHAIKHMLTVENIHITHFTYNETCIDKMSDHILQPVVFRALNNIEQKQFITENPRYKTELYKYSVDDPLVKYYGLKVDDIVYIEDNDRQTGLVVEYGLICENL